MKNTAQKLAVIRQQIHDAEQKYHRQAGSVSLLAVSKTRSPEEISMAIACEQYEFGENYAQEAVDKLTKINDPALVWHFIGPIQSNKTRQIAEHFAWVHSLDRLKIAKRLNDTRPNSLPPLNICIQVNISDETTKAGITPDEVINLADEIVALPRLLLRGLMALPAPSNSFEKQRTAFRQLRECLERLKSAGHNVDTLSMGTTDDMEAAIAEGATIVRIGTAIFGARA